MKIKIINKIIKEMQNDLNEKQLDKLVSILHKTFNHLELKEKDSKMSQIEIKENKQVLKTFLSEKKLKDAQKEQ